MLVLLMSFWVLLSFVVLHTYFMVKISWLMFWLTCALWAGYSWFAHLLKWWWFMVQILGVVLLIYFSTSHLWWLMLTFEISLLPIMFIILGFGGQSSRLPATLYFLIYTLLFSLPMLMLLLSLKVNLNLMVSDYYVGGLTFFLLIMCFLVKLPVFGLHYWLPKAHVESPTLGSCILAAILLKTGCYGIFVVLKWSKYIVSPVWALWGAVVTAILASIQVDVKKLIAFSSVCHLNLGLAGIFSGSVVGFSSFLIVSLTHGFVSSGLFYLAGVVSNNSRLIYYLKGNLLMGWLLVLMFNFSHPACHSLLGEGLVFSSLLLNSVLNMILLLVCGMFVLWFSIVLWLNLKNQMSGGLSMSTIVLSWGFLMVLLMWFNTALFF